jgi:cell division protein FtsZ
MADEVLTAGVGGITDLITTPGLINVDFADVRTVMEDAGSAVLGIGKASGDERAKQAADRAIASPLLETSMEGAQGVLLSIAGPSSLSLHEVNIAATVINEHTDPEAEIIFGAVIDDALGEDLKVTVIAAGLDGKRMGRGATSSFGIPSASSTSPSSSGDDDDDLGIPSFVQG